MMSLTGPIPVGWYSRDPNILIVNSEYEILLCFFVIRIRYAEKVVFSSSIFLLPLSSFLSIMYPFPAFFLLFNHFSPSLPHPFSFFHPLLQAIPIPPEVKWRFTCQKNQYNILNIFQSLNKIPFLNRVEIAKAGVA